MKPPLYLLSRLADCQILLRSSVHLENHSSPFIPHPESLFLRVTTGACRELGKLRT